MTEHIHDLLSAYIDDEITQDERERVEVHLRDCPACAELVSDLLEMKLQVLSTYRFIDAPDSLEERVIRSIRSAAEPERAGNRGMRFWLLIPLLGLLVVAAAALTRTGALLFKLASVALKVILHLAYAAGGLLGTDPYLIAGFTVCCLLIIIGSSLSLKLLFKTDAVGG